MDIPVYLFTGFLESGKTKFIQETLEDSRFNDGQRTLLLVCEEGIEEYDSSRFSGSNVFIEEIEKEDLSVSNLGNLCSKCKAERVLVEYNGMWMLSELYNAFPNNWIIAQEFTFANAETYINYNSNMRSLVVDKLNSAELVVFNRYNDSILKEELHKIVRGISRRADIAYEYVSGEVVYDDIEDPLPFDVNADVIEIKDVDYALWYRDLSEDPKKYIGKTVKFRGLTAKHISLPAKTFVIGRPVMTCCVEDIQYAGLVCKYENADKIANKQWVMLEATVKFEKSKAYGKEGPVLYANSVAITDKPEQEVATFY